MPTYSYACKDCENAFDLQQAFTDDALTVCPECGGTLRKRYGSVGVVFKGSGFYRTDSRKADSRKGAVSAESKPSAAESKSSAGSAPSGTSSSTSDSSTTSSSSGTKSTGSTAAATSA